MFTLQENWYFVIVAKQQWYVQKSVTINTLITYFGSKYPYLKLGVEFQNKTRCSLFSKNLLEFFYNVMLSGLL